MNPLFISEEDKAELSSLSKLIYGAKNKWLKILRHGASKTIEYSKPTKPHAAPRPLKAEVQRFTVPSLLEYLRNRKIDLSK